MRLRGFSLVELLVVISIVTLMAAFILPGLTRAREYAYFTSCKNSLRQLGIGFLCYGGSNRGRMPIGLSPCPGTDGAPAASPSPPRRLGAGRSNWHGGWGAKYTHLGELGYISGGWSTSGSFDYVRSATIFQQIVGGLIGYGQNWDESIAEPSSGMGTWMGRPRMKGTYLPLEAFWDPIVKVRGWHPWNTNGTGSASTEEGRDAITRVGHNQGGNFGYQLFTYSVGCAKNVHDLRKSYSKRYAEQPYRYATRSRNMQASNKPETWVGCCLPPVTVEIWQTMERFYPSHFGFRDPVPGGWRFNVVHLDGHVDDATWMEVRTKETSMAWTFYENYSSHTRSPYGWRYKDTGDAAVYGSADTNLEPMPGFPRAFDCNK